MRESSKGEEAAAVAADTVTLLAVVLNLWFWGAVSGC